MDLSFLQQRDLHYIVSESSVSILVLMDLSFLRMSQLAIIYYIYKVSILVLMDLSFLQAYTTSQYQAHGQFQSLFLWIFRSYRRETGGIRCLNRCVSILVLMDLSFLHYGLDAIKVSFYVSILVLMDLSFLQPTVKINTRAKSSFNPCSYGSFVLTMISSGVLIG